MSEIIVPQTVPAAEQVYDVFFCHVPNSTFIFPNGALAVFTGGRYATSDPAKAAYLQYEIDQGNSHIFRNPECMQLKQEDLAPDAEYRKRVIAEYLAQQAAAKLNPADMGDYSQGNLNVTDTASVGAAAADSSSGASAPSADLVPAAPTSSGGAVAVALSGLDSLGK